MWTRRGATGRVKLAIRENETRAGMIGYNTFKLAAVTVAGVLAGLAGLMNALLNTSVTSNLFRADTTINALLITIIGGVGTLVGPILGVGVIQIVGYWLNMLTPRGPLFFGVMFILIVLFSPHGLLGTLQARRRRMPKLKNIVHSQFKQE
ncbi:MAG: branched-chain amino acid ABC transporter permease [Chloroflexia bacterium]